MKKFLTVLLALSVVFTYTFGAAGSVFADTTTQVESRSAALGKITEAYDAAESKLSTALNAAKGDTTSRETDGASVSEWEAACEEAYKAAIDALDLQLAKAYQVFATEESKATEAITAYDWGTDVTSNSVVGFKAAIDEIDLGELVVEINGTTVWDTTAQEFTAISAKKLAYENALKTTLETIKSYDVNQFAKDDKVTKGTETKSSYEWAIKAQTDAIAKLSAFGKYNAAVPAELGLTATNFNKEAVEEVYKVEHAGTLGEAKTGSFFEALKGLKTVATLTTDSAKIEYAKTKSIAQVKSIIEKQRAAELDVQNEIIFAQSVASKPNQDKINEAKEKIKEINAKYDAMVTVWEYRLTNADYKVIEKVAGTEYVDAYYNDSLYNDKINSGYSSIGHFTNGIYTPEGIYAATATFADVAAILSATKAEKVLDDIAALKKEAESLKATILVDGDVFIDIDAALEEAMHITYMTGTKADLDYVLNNSAAHIRIHQLIGTDCKGNVKRVQVTVGGKKYDNVAKWDTSNYSTENTKTVKAIIKEAKETITAAETVADADAAFLAAYEKYDAVMTTAEQAALFHYNGSLYGKDKAAEAELDAYIEYKVSLMKDAPAAADAIAAAIETYYKANYKAEVVDEASFNAAVSEVKAFVDTLKTKTALTDEAKAIASKATAVKRAVTLEQRDEVLVIYDEIVAYEKYIAKIGVAAPGNVTSAKELIKTDIERLEDLAKADLDAQKKALGAVEKLTLAQKSDVEAFAAAQKAYNDLYGADGDYKDALTTATDYKDADAYEAKIFDLEVEAVRALIAALPANGATAAQIKEAKAALKALGYEGICRISDVLLTKLNRLDQNLMFDVKALKLTASSVAKKGSITVKWTVKGNASAAEAYEIWKSKKANSGYKKAFTTVDGTKRTYKNTKELKKGTRYYYKVRAIAYDVDGNKVTSDWSNKAYRIAK